MKIAMTHRLLTFIAVLLSTQFLTGPVLAQNEVMVDVRDIKANPATYLNEVVTVEGEVAQYENDKAATHFYTLKGQYGGAISVRTSQSEPEPFARYSVTGVVSEGTIPGMRGKTLYLSEINRRRILTAEEVEVKRQSEQENEKELDLYINSDIPLQAQPGQVINLKVKTYSHDSFPPMLRDIKVDAKWSISPDTGVELNSQTGELRINKLVPGGTKYTIFAEISRGNTQQTIMNELYVFTRQSNPFIGVWIDRFRLIGELVFRADGKFSITVRPFESYKDSVDPRFKV